MSINICREIRSDEIEIGDQLDLEDDEYADNEMAVFGFATVTDIIEWYDKDNYRWIRAKTSQGEFDFPASHYVKVKVIE